MATLPNSYLRQVASAPQQKVFRQKQLSSLAPEDVQRFFTQNQMPNRFLNPTYSFNQGALQEYLNSLRPAPATAQPTGQVATTTPAPVLPATPATPATPTVPMVQPAVNPGNTPVYGVDWNKAYDPSLGKAKSQAAMSLYGYDTTGYQKAVTDFNKLLNATYGSVETLMGDNDGSGYEYQRASDSPFIYDRATGEYKRNSSGSGILGKAFATLASKSGKVNARNEKALEEFKVGLSPELLEQEKKLKELQSAYNTKYMPEALTKQIQGMMDAGLDFAKTGLVHSNDEALRRLTAVLSEKGITDLRQIGVAQDTKGKPVYYNKATGQDIGRGVVTFKGGSGDGNLDVFLKQDPKSGYVYFTTDFESPEKTGYDYFEMALPAIMGAMVAGPVGAQLGAAAGGAAGAAGAGAAGTAAATAAGTAAGYGLTSGVTSAMQGGDFGQGFLSGAIGGLASGVGGLNVGQSLLGSSAPAWQTAAINQGLAGATRGGLQAAMGGQDILTGALTGGATGAIGGGLQGLGSSFANTAGPIAGNIGRVGTQALAGGLSNVIQGGDFGQGLASGAIGGLSSLASRGITDLVGDQVGKPIAGALGGIAGNLLKRGLGDKLFRRG